ncbi:MAG: hypothetical protein KDE58_38520, partial [Caldilineaceae bacterium]|nr:hypothetical protein [Caldilineaceae bacterium]
MQKFSVHHALLRPIARQEDHLRWRFFCQFFLAALILVVMICGVKRSTAIADDTLPTATSTSTPEGPNTRGLTHPVSASQPTVVSAASGYCPSNGGSSEFERITNAILTPNGDGTMRLQVNVFIANPEGCVAGQECPTYEASPEHVNAWIDWNGDKQWDASERVMDKDLTGYSAINYAGTMTGISQFAIPATFTNTTWLRANVGYLHDPNDACELSWQYGNVLDQPVRL